MAKKKSRARARVTPRGNAVLTSNPVVRTLTIRGPIDMGGDIPQDGTTAILSRPVRGTNCKQLREALSNCSQWRIRSGNAKITVLSVATTLGIVSAVFSPTGLGGITTYTHVVDAGGSRAKVTKVFNIPFLFPMDTWVDHSASQSTIALALMGATTALGVDVEITLTLQVRGQR